MSSNKKYVKAPPERVGEGGGWGCIDRAYYVHFYSVRASLYLMKYQAFFYHSEIINESTTGFPNRMTHASTTYIVL